LPHQGYIIAPVHSFTSINYKPFTFFSPLDFFFAAVFFACFAIEDLGSGALTPLAASLLA